MESQKLRLTKEQLFDYFILAARCLLAFTFLTYGWGKLTGGQFGVSEKELMTPVKDVNLFRLSWYLFDHQPFKAFIGIAQIVCALMLLMNRTVILGGLLFLPIAANILIIDITFVKLEAFYWRLSYYLILDLLILFHYKGRMVAAFHSVTKGMSTHFKFPLWSYCLIPFFIVILEVMGVLPRIIFNFVFHYKEMIKDLEENKF